MNSKTLCTLGFAAMIAGGVVASAGAQTFNVQTVMSDLNNPRGLAFGPDGSLYVAEAGLGANGNTSGPSFVDGNNETDYFGLTGGVVRLKNGVQTPVISDLPSVANPTGAGAGGISNIAFASNGTPYGVINFGGELDARTTMISAGATNASLLGTVVQLNFGSSPSTTLVTDVSAYAKANNLEGPTQPGKPFETNPYGLTTLKNGGFAVTDAGGNFVATLDGNGTINGTVSLPNYANQLFPNVGGPTSQSVPTGVTEGPDGTLYVSELGGFPFVPGASHIDVIKNGVLTTRFGGFTSLMDVTYYDGELYAIQLDTNGLLSNNPGPGELLEIDPTTGQTKVLFSGLDTPGGLAVENENTFFVSTGSSEVGTGAVVRLTEVPEPSTFALLIGLAGASMGCVWKRRRNR
jgi:hypothetical protein